MSNFVRRWRIPISLSILLNLLSLAWVALSVGESNAPNSALSVHRLHLVLPPIQIAKKKRNSVRPKNNRPAEPKVDNQVARAGGAHRGRAQHRASVQLAYAPPTPIVTTDMSPPPPTTRDPFAPQDPSAETLKLAPKPTGIVVEAVANSQPKPGSAPSPNIDTSSSAVGTNTSTGGLPAPSSNTFDHQSSSPNIGTGTPGASGSGNGSGTGAGNGGVLPFGMGQGRGGDGGRHRIVYVLDISKSMTSRLERSKQELRACLRGLSQDDLFDIIAFGGETIPMESYIEPATSGDLKDASDFLDGLHLMNGTDLDKALNEALAMKDVNEVAVLTDGVPTWGITDFRTIARDMRNSNIHHIPIDTIGLVGKNLDGTDSTFDATNLLKQIASESGGKFSLVPLGVATDD